jgi:hypothetical protein
MAAGLLAGVALSSPLPNFRGTMLGALAGLIVAAAGSGGPSLISRRVALITAALGLVLTAIAFATGDRPVWAAVAMAAVAVLTSLGAAAGPLGAVLGFLLSLAYLLVALMARTANLFELVSSAGPRPTSRSGASPACWSSSSGPRGGDEASRKRSGRRRRRPSRSARCGRR